MWWWCCRFSQNTKLSFTYHKANTSNDAKSNVDILMLLILLFCDVGSVVVIYVFHQIRTFYIRTKMVQL